jgi:ectoine hydroxylase-related dioxygenase (phytanoyl-CoA dioxygenase family)
MEVTAAQRAAYADDGVVVLREALDERWLALLETAVARNLAEPGEHAQHYTPEGQPGQYFGDYCNWGRIDEFRQVAFDSGLAGTARDLMGSRTARFFHEHVLVKEPGTREVTPWHHDQPYYCDDGHRTVS